MICSKCGDKCSCEDTEFTKEIKNILKDIKLEHVLDSKEESELIRVINTYGRKKLKDTIIKLTIELKNCMKGRGYETKTT